MALRFPTVKRTRWPVATVNGRARTFCTSAGAPDVNTRMSAARDGLLPTTSAASMATDQGDAAPSSPVLDARRVVPFMCGLTLRARTTSTTVAGAAHVCSTAPHASRVRQQVMSRLTGLGGPQRRDRSGRHLLWGNRLEA